jgi:hypothetical protein
MVDWAQMIVRMIEKEDTNHKSTRIKVMEIPKAINNNDRQLAKSHKRSSRKISMTRAHILLISRKNTTKTRKRERMIKRNRKD